MAIRREVRYSQTHRSRPGVPGGSSPGCGSGHFSCRQFYFTSPHPQGYGFTTSQYGAMFLPQVILAILASSLAQAFARRWHLKRVFLLGLGSNLVSMILLALSNFFMPSTSIAYDTLLLATAALGLGFGMTVMATNTYAEEFFPGRADSAVLALNALLGAGTALAPVFVIVFVGLGAWWLLPVLVGVVLVMLLLFNAREPLQVAADSNAPGSAKSSEGFMRGLPRRFWLYAAVVLLYGIVETLNGNWSTIYLNQQRGVSTQWASLALTAFWAMVTVGRVLAAVAAPKVPARWIYLGLPMLLVVAFLAISQVSTAIGGVLAFGLAGLACSAFFPLSISIGLRRISAFDSIGLRRIDCLLPGRLRNRRLRHRIDPERNRYSLVYHLRGSQSRGWCDDRACLPGDQATDHESC